MKENDSSTPFEQASECAGKADEMRVRKDGKQGRWRGNELRSTATTLNLKWTMNGSAQAQRTRGMEETNAKFILQRKNKDHTRSQGVENKKGTRILAARGSRSVSMR